MKIKQTTFYAIRILCRIHKEPNKVVTSREIAEKEDISQGVTLKILRDLALTGVVRAHQGRGQACGGFSLTRSIDEITMADVIASLEGLDIGANLAGSARESTRGLEKVCTQINECLGELFSGYSIRHLIEPDIPACQTGSR